MSTAFRKTPRIYVLIRSSSVNGVNSDEKYIKYMQYGEDTTFKDLLSRTIEPITTRYVA